jgi:uncharacterized protein with PQ loop repeat
MASQVQEEALRRRSTKSIDSLMTLASVIHPLTAIPQVYSIYATQDVSGVSLWTWLGFMLLGLVFLTYSIVHKIKPLILNQILWFIVDFLVVIGIIIYS